MEEGCFRFGVITNDRATIRGEGQDKQCLHQINQIIMVERKKGLTINGFIMVEDKKGAQTIAQLQRNVLRNEYAFVLQQKHQKTLI